MSRHANTDHPVHDVFVKRHSPYAIDPSRDVSEDDVNSLLEAARWAMSSYNDQPWRYVVASKSRNAQLWDSVLNCLVEPNQAWAQHAPVLMLGLYQQNFAFNGEPNGVALHDLGAASAFLTIEATARGLCVHQMGGIVPEKIVETFSIPDGLKPATALAVGYYLEGGDESDERVKRDAAPRTRKPFSEIIIAS
ncbi:MAG: nitroreductase family protein [Pseudomonadota bacterium]